MGLSAPQRIAVLADIHGNADALRAVLPEIDRAEPDLILCLGDHFSGPLAAGETAALLRARPDILCLRGNHDRYLIDETEMGPSDLSAARQLSAADMDWLRALPAQLSFAGIFACHATPGADDVYWLETVTPEGQVVKRPKAEIAALVQGISAPLMLCAHTHLPGMVRIGAQVIVNPGSVGCPAYDDTHPVPHVVETGSPEARFVTLNARAQGWQVAFHAVPYDPARMVACARSEGREDWARAVETGWLE